MSKRQELRWAVPYNWVWTSLSEVGDIVAGGTPPTKEPSYWANEVNWISPADLTGYSAKTIRRGAKSISKIGLANSSAKVMPAGSVHFSSRAPIGHVVISAEPLATNQGFKSVVPAQGIFNDYIYYYLLASREYARKRASGTTFLELSGKAFGLIPIPIPPSAAQHRIVAKIEELFSELDKGIESLKTARAQLAVYRQVVLKHAFEGKLTADWRKKNKGKLETPEQLLARIKREREAYYERQLEEWRVAGKKGSKPKVRKSLPLLTAGELNELPDLADGWAWTRFGLLDIELKRGPFGSSITKSMFVPSGFKVYQQGNAIYRDSSRGSYFITGEKYEELSGFAVSPGDFIVSCAGTVGKVFELPKCADKGVINQALMRVRTNDRILKKGFFARLFESDFFQRKVLSDAKGTAMVNLAGIKELNLVPVAICGMSEQKVINELLDERLAQIDACEQTIATSFQQAEVLRQSILKKAFSGQLVPQDPNDEPASVLLERIRAEKMAQSKGKTGKTPT